MILVRHSLPEIDPNRPACTWRLSAEGRRRCRDLAAELAWWRPEVIVTSVEPKAVETGQIVAGVLQLPWRTAAGLHEHERPDTPFYANRQEFEEKVAEFFARPDELVLGVETARQALNRFRQAVAAVLEQHLGQKVAIVTHGTVMSLLVAERAGLDAFAFWRVLGLPEIVFVGGDE
ncbi:MAG: histidine phosphatase family protein [Chloroflexota bacterium]